MPISWLESNFHAIKNIFKYFSYLLPVMGEEEERVTMVCHQTEPRNSAALLSDQTRRRSPAQAGLKRAGGGPHLWTRRRNKVREIQPLLSKKVTVKC